MKSVVVLGLFAVIIASAIIYSSHQFAIAERDVEPNTPTCTIYFDPGAANVKPGETFKVNVLVDDVRDLWGYEIGLVFDPNVIEYVGAKEPHWMFISGGTNPKEYLFWVAATNPQNGKVELMEFTFKAKAEGSSSLGFYIDNLATLKYWDAPKDYVGWPIPHMVSEGVVTVS